MKHLFFALIILPFLATAPGIDDQILWCHGEFRPGQLGAQPTNETD